MKTVSKYTMFYSTLSSKTKEKFYCRSKELISGQGHNRNSIILKQSLGVYWGSLFFSILSFEITLMIIFTAMNCLPLENDTNLSLGHWVHGSQLQLLKYLPILWHVHALLQLYKILLPALVLTWPVLPRISQLLESRLPDDKSTGMNVRSPWKFDINFDVFRVILLWHHPSQLIHRLKLSTRYYKIKLLLQPNGRAIVPESYPLGQPTSSVLYEYPTILRFI